jgi:hypothetical protein
LYWRVPASGHNGLQTDREQRDTTAVLIYRIVAFEFVTHHCAGPPISIALRP